MVLDVDAAKRRISLGLKQVQRNPWEQFVDEHPIGTEVEGEIRNITEFGLFIGITADIDGMVHMSDLSWDEPGEQAMPSSRRARSSRPRCSTSTSRRSASASASSSCVTIRRPACFDRVHKGEIVTCVVTAVQANGIEVQVDDVLTGFIRRAELARDKADQRPDRFAVGEKVDAKIISIDRAARKLALTIKGKEMDEDKQAVSRIRHVGLGRLARRHPGRRDPPPEPAEPRQLSYRLPKRPSPEMGKAVFRCGGCRRCALADGCVHRPLFTFFEVRTSGRD